MNIYREINSTSFAVKNPGGPVSAVCCVAVVDSKEVEGQKATGINHFGP